MRLRLHFLGVLVVGLGCATGRNYSDPEWPRFAGQGGNQQPARDTLRVVTFNVKFSEHVDRAIDLLRTEPHLCDADLVALQEMDEGAAQRIAAALGLNYVYYPATVHPHHGRNFGDALLSRWPIEEDRKVVLPYLGRFRRTQRIAVGGSIRIRGERVRVYSVHLETLLEMGPSHRRAQVEALLAAAGSGSGRVIIAGDMNGKGVGSVFLQNGYTWPTKDLGGTCWRFGWDHIFVRGFRLRDAGSAGVVRENRGASDHKPVWVVLVPDPRLSPASGLGDAADGRRGGT